MPTLKELRDANPWAKDMSDGDLLSYRAQLTGQSVRDTAAEFGIYQNDDGFVSSGKRVLAGLLDAGGEMYGMATGDYNNAAKRYAKDVEFHNPSEINSLQDIVDKPGTALASAAANGLTFLIPGKGLQLAGNALRSAKYLTAARMVDNPLTQAALAGAPSLGRIGDAQRESGQGQNIPLQVAGALGVGAIENLGGVQRMMGFGRQARRLTEAEARSQVGFKPFLKNWVKAGGEEGLEEIAQSPIEQYASYQDPTSGKSVQETLFGGAMGTLGGLALGPLGARAQHKQGKVFATAIDSARAAVADREAPYETRAHAATFLNDVMANDHGAAIASPWYQSVSEALVQDQMAVAQEQRAKAGEQVDMLQPYGGVYIADSKKYGPQIGLRAGDAPGVVPGYDNWREAVPNDETRPPVTGISAPVDGMGDVTLDPNAPYGAAPNVSGTLAPAKGLSLEDMRVTAVKNQGRTPIPNELAPSGPVVMSPVPGLGDATITTKNPYGVAPVVSGTLRPQQPPAAPTQVAPAAKTQAAPEYVPTAEEKAEADKPIVPPPSAEARLQQQAQQEQAKLDADPARDMAEKLLSLLKPGRKGKIAKEGVDYAGVLRTFLGFEGDFDGKLEAVAKNHGYKDRQRAEQIIFGYNQKGKHVPGALDRLFAVADKYGFTLEQAQEAVRALGGLREGQYGLTPDQVEIAKDTGALETGIASENQGKMDFREAAGHGMLSQGMKAHNMGDAAAVTGAADTEDKVESELASQAADAHAQDMADLQDAVSGWDTDPDLAYQQALHHFSGDVAKAKAVRASVARMASIRAKQDAAGKFEEPKEREATQAPKYNHTEHDYAVAEDDWDYANELAVRGDSNAEIISWADLDQDLKDAYTQAVKDVFNAPTHKVNQSALEKKHGDHTDEALRRRPKTASAQESDDAGTAGDVEPDSRQDDQGSSGPEADQGSDREGQQEVSPWKSAWDQYAQAHGLVAWDALTDEQRGYIDGSADQDEFNEAAGEVAAEDGVKLPAPKVSVKKKKKVEKAAEAFEPTDPDVIESLVPIVANVVSGDLTDVEQIKDQLQDGSVGARTLTTAIARARQEYPVVMKDIKSVAQLVAHIEATEPAFSESTATEGTTVESVEGKIKQLFFSPQRFDSVVQIVQTADDLPANAQGALSQAKDPKRVQGITHNGKVYLIASNIKEGSELSVFLHEVGVHLGMEKLIGAENMTKLVKLVREWAGKNDGSQESKIAKAALERANASSSKTDEEVIAYFVEEAVDAGVNPATYNAKTPKLTQWFRQFWAAVKASLRKLGLGRIDSLNAQDIVNLAAGAARLEVNGAWHGTAAAFRNFRNEFFSTGEGNGRPGAGQAFGAGTYLAQRTGIAKGYWEADVRRKTKGDGFYMADGVPITDPGLIRDLQGAVSSGVDIDGAYLQRLREQYESTLKKWEGNPQLKHDAARLAYSLAELDSVQQAGGVQHNTRTQPDGTLMRVDHNIADGEFLDWDTLLDDQAKAVQELLRDYTDLAELVDNYADRRGRNPTGEDLYRALVEYADEGGFDSWVNPNTGERMASPTDADSKAIVSRVLDVLGVKGIKYLDQVSRNGTWRYRGPLTGVEASMADAIARKMSDGNSFTEAVQDTQNYLAQRSPNRPDVTLQLFKSLKTIKESDFTRVDPTRNLVIFNDKNIQRVTSQVGARRDSDSIKFSEAPAAVRDFAGKYAGSSGQMVVDNTSHVLSKMGNAFKFLHDLVDEHKDKLPAVKDWYAAVQKITTTRNKLEKDAETIANMAGALKGGTAKVNKFIGDSTFDQKWGFDATYTDADGKAYHVKADPEMRREFLKLSQEEQAVVKAVFKHGEDMKNLKDKLLKEVKVDKLLGSTNRLAGPYAPLKRFGNYLVELKSQALLDAEQAKNDEKVEELKRDSSNYVIASFDTIGHAKQYAQANTGKFAFVDTFEKPPRYDQDRQMPTEVFDKIMAAMNLNDEVNSPARAAMASTIRDLYFQTLDEQSARMSGLKRKNRAGYDEDMIRAFLSHAKAEAAFIAQMQHGKDVTNAFYKMKEQAKDGRGNRVNQDAFNTFAAHYAETVRYEETPIADRVMAFTSAWQLLTSLGYHFQNATQGMLVTVPKLAADFNDYPGAWGHLVEGYKVLGQLGGPHKLDLLKIKNADLRDALQHATDLNLLDVGMDNDMTQFEQTRTGIAPVDKASALAKRAITKLRNVSRWVETANRVSAGVAAYNLARQHGKSVEEAKDYVVKILASTQGDFSRAGAPLLLKKLPKFVTQYKKYQLMMAGLYAQAFRQAFRGATPEERAIGKRMLAFKLFHTFAVAGALGFPLMNYAGPVLMAAFSSGDGDDEPKDVERWLRDLIGDEDLAQLLLHGPLSMTGLDMSGKLGDDKVFSILPYGEWDFSSATGATKTLVSLAGPAAGLGVRMTDGIGLMGRGELDKGVEKLLPSGLSNALKAFRIANEGYTLRNGDLMFQPEDINGFALILDGLGMPSAEMKHMDYLRSQQYEVNRFFIDRAKDIEHRYYKAFKDGDTDEMADLRDHWMAMQDGKDRLRPLFNDSSDALKRQPLSTLLKYPQTAKKREAKLQRGVPD